MTTRRYGEDEAREIFALATAGETREKTLAGEPTGLTLADLQRIGQEVGIEPSRIATAVERLESRERPMQVRRSFGLPIGMSRVITLPRAPNDREWERLVVECRNAFGHQGVTSMEGTMRQWSVGNLHVSVEPTADGAQLRMSTLKDDALVLNLLTVLMSTFALIVGGVVTAGGKPEKAVAVVGLFGGIAVAAFVANLIRMPPWARARKQQINELAEHAVEMLSSGTPQP